jgi:hypothetical protein
VRSGLLVTGVDGAGAPAGAVVETPAAAEVDVVDGVRECEGAGAGAPKSRPSKSVVWGLGARDPLVAAEGLAGAFNCDFSMLTRPPGLLTTFWRCVDVVGAAERSAPPSRSTIGSTDLLPLPLLMLLPLTVDDDTEPRFLGVVTSRRCTSDKGTVSSSDPARLLARLSSTLGSSGRLSDNTQRLISYFVRMKLSILLSSGA